MLKYQKIQIDKSIDLMKQAHSELFTHVIEQHTEETLELLQLCQELMIKIGETIENSEGENCPGIHDMELYCEYVYKTSQNINNIVLCADYLDKLYNLFNKIIADIKNITVKKEIVFFPYNAAMWDCMESIWIAADKDPAVTAYVIPIPYYEKNSLGTVINEKYDGGKFPPYVPITDYRAYKLEEHRPDIAYIHNPFDQFNNVSSVHPDYYSFELKKNILKVVYVPYFITYDSVFVTHRELPSYYFVDYIVVQCEKMIESFAPTIKREKFITVGNPIADRIINLDKNRPEIPDAWKSMLSNGSDFGGKKAVMLNTSLSMIMKVQEVFLEKIENVIHTFRDINDVILVWRPHPLLHTTLQKMGSEYYQKFLNIEEMFLEERIGILDKMADIGVTVAMCDAYIGEEASSVVHMFGVAGKPCFYMNLQTDLKVDINEECKVTTFGTYLENDFEYFVAEEYRYICKRNINTGEVELIAQIPGTRGYPYGAYKDIYKQGDNIYLQPYSGQGICIYNIREDTFRKLYMKESIEYGFQRMIYENGSLFLMPKDYPYIVKFDLITEEFQYLNPDNVTAKKIAEKVTENTTRITYQLPLQFVQKLRAKELFLRTGGNIIWENDENRLQDFLYYIEEDNLIDKKQIQSPYTKYLATMDGTCGRKIHEFVKNSLV